MCRQKCYTHLGGMQTRVLHTSRGCADKGVTHLGVCRQGCYTHLGDVQTKWFRLILRLFLPRIKINNLKTAALISSPRLGFCYPHSPVRSTTVSPDQDPASAASSAMAVSSPCSSPAAPYQHLHACIPFLILKNCPAAVLYIHSPPAQEASFSRSASPRSLLSREL